MAGGNLSARQKMINLMYLVFIAMLALNMSKKVLTSFGFMKERLAESNVRVDDANKGVIESLAKKAVDSPERYRDSYTKAKLIKDESDSFFNFLDGVQSKLTEKIDDPTDYESMDSEEAGDAFFFARDNKPSKQGQEFLDRIKNYSALMISKLDDEKYAELISQIENRFATKDQTIKDGKIKIPWLESRYKGFPLVTTLTNIEQIQADIRTTESDIYNTFLGTKLIEDASLRNYEGIVALNKSAYFSGETVTGKIVMGKYDASFVPDNFESNVGGKVESGQVDLNFRAGRPGTHPIKGKFIFKQKDGEDIEVKFDSEYTVITEPSSAVISADKMNVVYRGLDNPISISVPGVGDSNVKATAPGLKKTGKGKYMMNPTSGNSVTINVSAKLSSGKTIKTPMEFRIMDIPAPRGAIRKQTGNVDMPKASLGKATVGVILPDFVFDLTLRTTSFKLKVPGQATVLVNGARMNAKAKSAIAKAKRGDMVNIFDIKSSLVGSASGYRIKKASPVMIEIK